MKPCHPIIDVREPYRIGPILWCIALWLLLVGNLCHRVSAAMPGSVVAWGYSGPNGCTVVPVEPQSGVTAIAVGEYHTLALKGDGNVVAWGSTRFRLSSVPLAAQSGVVASVAGYYHSVAIVSLPSLLTAKSSIEDLVLSWPTNAAGFTLQSTTDMTSPVVWLDVPNAPVVAGAQCTVTNALSGGARLFRLRSQQP